MRIVFMGTPDFALPSLRALVESGYEVVLVVTQTDKPQDRGKEIKAPPIKSLALSLNIPVLQPNRLNREPEMVEAIRAVSPDLLITCAFGQILPQTVLDIPVHGTINIHGSLLPLLRGAAPIQRAIIEGHTKSGITTMMTDIGMDTGDMLVKAEIGIDPEMTAGELHDHLSLLGAETLIKTIRMLEAGNLVRVPQNHEQATYAPRMTKDTGHIDWAQTDETIHRLVRGTLPWPGAWTMAGSQKMRIWWTEREPMQVDLTISVPGTVLGGDEKGLLVKAGEGVVRITDIQMPSAKRMRVADFLRGHELPLGMVLT